jgi:AcrR family transcriptional regulator
MTDEQILALAGQLWTENAGILFTMERLAEVTGVSRATLYRRFGSREAILQRLVNEQSIDVQELSRPDIPARIMQAARSLFSRYGLAGVTVEQIAQEAGVGSATVYRHFGSKEKLVEAFIQASRPRQLLQNFTVGEPSDLEADLIALATTMLEFINDSQDLIRLMLFGSQRNEHLEQLRSTQGRTVTTLADYLAGHMAKGNLEQGDPFDLALAFTGMLFGLVFVGSNYYDHPVTDMKYVAQLVTRIFLNGLAQHHSQQTEKHP